MKWKGLRFPTYPADPPKANLMYLGTGASLWAMVLTRDEEMGKDVGERRLHLSSAPMLTIVCQLLCSSHCRLRIIASS